MITVPCRLPSSRDDVCTYISMGDVKEAGLREELEPLPG